MLSRAVIAASIAIGLWSTDASAENIAITCSLNPNNADQYIQFKFDMASSTVTLAYNVGYGGINGNGASFSSTMHGGEGAHAPFTMDDSRITWEMVQLKFVFDKNSYRLKSYSHDEKNNWTSNSQRAGDDVPCQAKSRPL